MVASPYPASLPAWTNWLFEGAAAPPVAPTASSADHNTADDLDFLDASVAAAPAWAPLSRQAAGHPRQQQAQDWLQAEPLQQISVCAGQWASDPRLPAIDADAAEVALAALALQPAHAAAGHGSISQLIQRVLQGTDPDLARQAARTAAHLQLSEVQELLAEQLQRNGQALGPQGRSDLLAALEVLGDGRCVRAMEAFLAEWSSRLHEHEAWRARHIVQVIRRGGRR